MRSRIIQFFNIPLDELIEGEETLTFNKKFEQVLWIF